MCKKKSETEKYFFEKYYKCQEASETAKSSYLWLKLAKMANFRQEEETILIVRFLHCKYYGNRSLKIYIASSRVPFLVWGRAATTVAAGFPLFTSIV